MNQPPQQPQVEIWITSRLNNVFNQRAIRFESSLYGPLLSYLRGFFPTAQRFMVKPQGLLRPERYFAEEDIDSDVAEPGSDDRIASELQQPASLAVLQQGGDVNVGNYSADTIGGEEMEDEDEGMGPDSDLELDDVSEDSYGDYTTSREVAGSVKGVVYPDFLVVKATDSLTDDTILLVIEVKKNRRSLRTSRSQIQNYLELAASKRWAPLLQGFLVVGATTETFMLNSDARNADIVIGPSFNTLGGGLANRMHNIAVENWY